MLIKNWLLLIQAILLASTVSLEASAGPSTSLTETELRGATLNDTKKGSVSRITSFPESSVFRTNSQTSNQAQSMIFEQKSLEAEITTLPVYKYESKGRPLKAMIILIHGLFQHGESLAPIAKHLAQNGYIAFSIDQRGHGYWHFGNGQNNPGYNIDFGQSAQDVLNLGRLLRSEHPGLPLFCLGESAGAAVALTSAASSPGLFDGLVLCAFATKPRAIHLLWMTEDITCNLFDWRREMKMSRYIKRFSSEDKRIVGETLNDPGCRQGVSLNELMLTCKFIRGTKAVVHHLPSNLPILLVEGQDDQVLSPRSSHKFYEKIRSQSKDLVMIPHCGHVLVSTEYIKPLVLSSIDDWLERHAPGQFSTNTILAGY